MAGDPSSLRLIGAILLISIGAMCLFFVKKNEKLEWNERLAAHLLCWTFIIKGLGNIAGNYTIQYYEAGDQGPDSPFWLFFATILNCDYAWEMALMALACVYPVPIFRSLKNLKIAYGFIVGITVIRYLMMILGSPMHTLIDLFGFYYLFCGLIWGTVYFKFRYMDDFRAKESSTNIANVAALLFIFIGGHILFNWAGFVFRSDYFLYIEMMSNLSGPRADYWWQALNVFLITTGLCILVAEIQQALRGNSSPILYIISIYFVLGLIGYAVLDGSGAPALWWRTGGSSLEATWITLTNSMHFTMIRPIIGVYVLLRYGLFETSEEMKPKAKRMVIILIVITSSALLELLQAILPINEMFTAVFLGILVALGIGWEEKSFESLMNASKQMRKGLDARWFPEFPVPKSLYTQLDRMMAALIIFILLLSFLIWQTETMYDWAATPKDWW